MEIAVAVILGIFSLICYILGIMQFCHKGIPLNNSYLSATDEERKEKDYTSYYNQSGVVLCLFGSIFALNATDALLRTDWIFPCVLTLLAAAIIYGIVSSILINNKNGREN